MYLPTALQVLEHLRDVVNVHVPMEEIAATTRFIGEEPERAIRQSIRIRGADGDLVQTVLLGYSSWVVVWQPTSTMAVVGYIGPIPKR